MTIIMRNKTFILVAISFFLTIIAGCWYSGNSLQIPDLAQRDNIPSFAIPIDCDLGRDCFVMHYVDLDRSSQIADFGCGRQTYDAHKGTDFAISDIKAMDAGVLVLAAAEGKVLRVRDGVADKLVSDQTSKERVTGQECGNGLVIAHDDGWSTQYCHLKRGSVRVQPNTKVEKGAVLGMVGASGLASFPHVHLTIRHQGKVVDPFVGEKLGTASCKIEPNSLWQKSLNYVPTGLIRSGFSTEAPTQTQLWSGKYKDDTLSKNSPALIFWVHTYGVMEGDIEHWQLVSPEGEIAIDRNNILDKSYRSWVSYVGKRQFDSGIWQGKYELIRNDRAIVSAQREIMIAE